MESAGDHALAFQLARVAQVDEQHTGLTVQRTRIVQAVGGDLGDGFIDHGLDGLAHGGLLQGVACCSMAGRPR